MDEVQLISAPECRDLFCSGGTSQHGDRVCLKKIFLITCFFFLFLWIAFVAMISSRYNGNGLTDVQLIISCMFLSVTVLPVAALSENQLSRWLTAQISECCLTSCTWWWKRYSRMTRLTSLSGKSSEKRFVQNWVGFNPRLFYGFTHKC